MKVVVIVIIALVVLLSCCVGGGYTLYYFGTSMAGEIVKPQIEGTPAINQYIGTISEVEFDFGQTSIEAQGGNDTRLAFQVMGSKGSGLVIVDQGNQDLSKPIWAILQIDGNTYTIFGNPPEELGAQTVEGSADETASEPTESSSESATPAGAGAADSE